MKRVPTDLEDVVLLEPAVHVDERGFFVELWQAERYRAFGVTGPFVQDNLSWSRRGVLRGLHIQWPRCQGKLVSVLTGEVFDVAVDVRRGSPTFGRWVGVRLSAEKRRQLWIPPGFAHGFVVLSDEALFHYKVTDYYSRADEVVVAWNDPVLGIDWPVADPVVGQRDALAPRLSELSPNRLPVYRP